MTNVKDFDERFPENTATISSIHYFIMYLYVHDYNVDPTPIMVQNEFIFTVINMIDMDTIFWKILMDERKKTKNSKDTHKINFYPSSSFLKGVPYTTTTPTYVTPNFSENIAHTIDIPISHHARHDTSYKLH